MIFPNQNLENPLPNQNLPSPQNQFLFRSWATSHSSRRWFLLMTPLSDIMNMVLELTKIILKNKNVGILRKDKNLMCFCRKDVWEISFFPLHCYFWNKNYENIVFPKLQAFGTVTINCYINFGPLTSTLNDLGPVTSTLNDLGPFVTTLN